jgi:RHS repeat-associated protein
MVNYHYDAQDRLLWARVGTDTTKYTYGSNGELRTRTIPGVGTTTYNYDAFGNLIRVILPDSTEIDYVIDGQNRRIGRKVDGALVEGWLYQNQFRPIAVVDSNGAVEGRFVYGSPRAQAPDYMIKGGNVYRLVVDHLGSVRLVVDTATGSIAQRLDYDEWGNVTLNTNPGFQPFGFGGGIYDPETGLTRLGARDYDALVGRFTLADPLRFAWGTNLYQYSSADPVNRSDPSGLASCDCSSTPLLVHLDPDAGYNVGPGTEGETIVHPYFAPRVARLLSQAIRWLNLFGVTPTINSGYRTAADQQFMRNGGSGKQPAAKQSRHQLGYAVDLNGTANPLFSLIILVMQDEGFHWSGLDVNQDNPHFEITPPSGDFGEQAREVEDFFNRCLAPE